MSDDQARVYANSALAARVAAADRHGLISLLIDGALEKINLARSHLSHGNIAAKGQHIGWAISIVGGLRGSLDMDQGGEIAHRLDDLYDYMERRLLEANLRNDGAMLAEVASLLTTIRSGWEAIPGGLRQQESQP